MTNTNKPTVGFHTNPERINKKGAPKKEFTWAGLLERIGEEIEPQSSKQWKELVGRRLWAECVNGNIGAIKELFNRMEGLPKVTSDITLSGKLSFADWVRKTSEAEDNESVQGPDIPETDTK